MEIYAKELIMTKRTPELDPVRKYRLRDSRGSSATPTAAT